MRNVKMLHRKMRQQNDGVDSTLDWEILQKRVQSEDGSSAVLASGVPVVNIERCEWLLSRHQIKNETWSFIKKMPLRWTTAIDKYSQCQRRSVGTVGVWQHITYCMHQSAWEFWRCCMRRRAKLTQRRV